MDVMHPYGHRVTISLSLVNLLSFFSPDTSINTIYIYNTVYRREFNSRLYCFCFWLLAFEIEYVCEFFSFTSVLMSVFCVSNCRFYWPIYMYVVYTCRTVIKLYYVFENIFHGLTISKIFPHVFLTNNNCVSD